MKKINGKYYGVSTDINNISDAKDLDIFNCLDTGVQYRYFDGKWYKQPTSWVDADDIDAGSGGGGGSSLPSVSSVDNGKVLTVVSGAWDKAAPSGGGSGSDVLVVMFTVTSTNDPNVFDVTSDKTFAEVYAAIDENKPIYGYAIKDSEPDAIITLYVGYAYNENGDGSITFEEQPSVDPTSVFKYCYDLNYDDSVYYYRVATQAGDICIYVGPGLEQGTWVLQNQTWEEVSGILGSSNSRVFLSRIGKTSEYAYYSYNIIEDDMRINVYKTIPSIDSTNGTISSAIVGIAYALEAIDVVEETISIGANEV